MSRLPRYALIAFAILVLLWLPQFVLIWTAPHDDSDPPNGISRMDPLRDNLTGCEYLWRFGALTPRLDADGKQICRKGKIDMEPKSIM